MQRRFDVCQLQAFAALQLDPVIYLGQVWELIVGVFPWNSHEETGKRHKDESQNNQANAWAQPLIVL